MIAQFFTVGRLFVAMLVFVFGCFLYTGAESLMTKWGFETKTSLQKQLVEKTEVVKQLEQANKALVADVIQIKKDNALAIKELESMTDRKNQLEVTAQRIVKSMETKSQEVKKALEEKKVVSPTTITLPLAEINALSQVNIDSLHEAFAQLST